MKSLKQILYGLVVVNCLLLVVFPGSAFAIEGEGSGSGGVDPGGTSGGIGGNPGGVSGTGSGGAEADPDCVGGLSCKPIDEILVDVIGIIAIFFGGIFILMMLIGAVMIMFGETANAKETGKTTIQWAVVGGVVGLLTGIIWLFLSGTFGSG